MKRTTIFLLTTVFFIISIIGFAQNSVKEDNSSKSFIRKANEQEVLVREKPQNGNGELVLKKILKGTEEMDNKGRAFNHCFMEPGSGLGYHKHTGTTETKYILKGTAEYIDENGIKHILKTGDVTFTDEGDSHSMYAIGDETLEFVAIVMFKNNRE